MAGESLFLVTPTNSGSEHGPAENDRALARAAREGDEGAFSALVRRHSSGLHHAVARILSDDSEAWDVVQMALLRAWQRLDRYDPRWSFSTWLYRIGTNLAIDVLRSRSSRERVHQESGEQRLRLVEPTDPTSRRADQREVEELLDRLVVHLTPQQRSAFVLREVRGLDTVEVAEIMGCSATTVRNHVFQARKVLRRELESRHPEYMPGARRS